MRRLAIVAGAAITIALIFVGSQFYRHRFVRQNRDLVRLLPPGDLTLVYADLNLLRRAQLLGLLANIKVAPDQQYFDFIRQTGFDYTRDLDAVVIGTDVTRTFIVGRGRFAWKRLEEFALSSQGRCDSAGCRVPSTVAGRWVNLITVQPDVLAVAITASPTAADDLRPPGRRLQDQIPDAPVWAKLSHALLLNPGALPLPMRIFAIDLQSAESVTVAATQDNIRLNADFPTAASADTARAQLQMQTGMLKKAVQEDRPERGSIASLLTAGTFHVKGDELNAIWPVTVQFLQALQ